MALIYSDICRYTLYRPEHGSIMSIANFKDKKVLVADPAAYTRNLIKNALLLLGITQVKESVDGRQAMAALQVKHYDLIISDWEMPELSGIDLLRKVRADDRMQNIPFIILTGDASDDNRDEAELMGVSAFITKPFRSDPLLEQVEKLLKKK